MKNLSILAVLVLGAALVGCNKTEEPAPASTAGATTGTTAAPATTATTGATTP